MTSVPRVVVFASGTKDSGGSGFEQLIFNIITGVLSAQMVAVASNHANGGVRRLANMYGIPFIHFVPSPDLEEAAAGYRAIVEQTGAEWILLSGWLKPVCGLNPTRTINIHPGLLPQFGGCGMYGHHVHQATVEAFQRGLVNYSAVTMHFVTQGGAETYDRGPTFFEHRVAIVKDDTADTLAARVNKVEHGWQSYITNLVIHKQITWDGVGQVVVPDWYTQQPFCPAELRDIHVVA